MKRYGFLIVLVLLLVCLLTPRLTQADNQLVQRIDPLDCIFNEVNDGLGTTVFVTPQACGSLAPTLSGTQVPVYIPDTGSSRQPTSATTLTSHDVALSSIAQRPLSDQVVSKSAPDREWIFMVIIGFWLAVMLYWLLGKRRKRSDDAPDEPLQ